MAGKKNMRVNSCKCVEYKEVKSYRTNYPFGKKSGSRRGAVKRTYAFCKDCGKKLGVIRS